jgi:DNA processing protein
VSPDELLGALSQIEQKFAPSRLNLAGPLELPLAHPRVAIIGSRTASPEGLKTASQLADTLARQGVLIVSGLARGIDTAAHNAAILAGGTTVAVLGTPLSQQYPKENASLQETIMERFLAISQFPEGDPIHRTNFILRNRTMALVADASVIVESGEGGGSLHQGWEALRLGRPLFIHAREFTKPGLEWPRTMASYGAVEFREASEILDAVPSASLGLAVASSAPS